CRECHGTGRKRQSKTLKVKIPAGVDSGSQLRMSQEGEAGPPGAVPGDLYIVLQVEQSEIFERQGNDLYLDLPLTFSQVALGDEVKIPTLEKEVTLKIPAGTQAGTQFRLGGKGIPDVHGRGRGDLFVLARIITPKRISKEQQRLFEELKKAEEKKSLLERIKEFAKEKLGK
ncbi:molecular chaperone DnaJ, partial [Candidatus Woesearchaeota archaeon]|nr:molecular chaperone DnaJ [Candidatus Woesearchaeota archaeon]